MNAKKIKKPDTKPITKPKVTPKPAKKHYDVIRPKQSKKSIPLLPPKVPTKTSQVSAVVSWFRKQVGSVVFGRLYAVLAVVILAMTTLLWSVLGAKLQSSNADQLVDPYLFQDHSTFHGADFPAAHSFLIKWPLFWLIRLLGETQTAYATVTVGVVLVTVATLALLLYRIERRPAVFGTLCLALASVLLLVPAQPYAGGLLPVNMAMLASRNLEYVVYLGSLLLLLRARTVRSIRFWLAVLCLGLLVASDKLFLAFAVGAAAIMLFLYALRQRPKLVESSARWLLGGLLAAVVGLALLAGINASHVTSVVGGSVSPYAVVQNGHSIGLGVIYSVLGLFTNFGANPAYDATQLHAIAHAASHRLLSLSGFSYLINIGIVIVGLFAVWKLIQSTFFTVKQPNRRLDTASNLSLALIFTTVVAFGVFIFTNHYYAVDARYLTIAVFTLFIVTASYARQRVLQRKVIVIAGVAIMAGIFLGIPSAMHTYSDQSEALDAINQRNTSVVQAVAQHKVTTLVGDYWRVIPARQASANKLHVLPLAGCTTVRDSLTSKAWNTDLTNHSFAYLLSLSGSLTDYPQCTLSEVTAAYGRPTASQLIAGTYVKPQELLLFYDHGIHKSVANAKTSAVTTTVAPITPQQVPDTDCAGPTLMTVVAHQDDDLLFTSPDLLHAIQSGYCVRTVYVTAGDSGQGQFYWLSREQGSQAAYDEMDGPGKDIWLQRTVSLNSHEYITIDSPKGHDKITLIFMHLPDGDINGDGFAQSGYESLSKLQTGKIKTIQSVDKQSTYDSSQLTAALVTLMQMYKPTEIHTQSPKNESAIYPDHSDHLSVGMFTTAAYDEYEQQQYANQVTIPIKYYIGYPTHQMPANVSGEDLRQKQAAFFAYGKFDDGVCATAEQCQHTATYGSYLSRQYALDSR